MEKTHIELTRISEYVRLALKGAEQGQQTPHALLFLAEHLTWAAAGLEVEAQRILRDKVNGMQSDGFVPPTPRGSPGTTVS